MTSIKMSHFGQKPVLWRRETQTPHHSHQRITNAVPPSGRLWFSGITVTIIIHHPHPPYGQGLGCNYCSLVDLCVPQLPDNVLALLVYPAWPS